MAKAATEQTEAPAEEKKAGAPAGKMDIKARLGSTKFVTDAEEHAHITVNPDICETCPHTWCINSCPAKCFEFVGGRMKFTYEDCVECGTCDIVCTPGSVQWYHPRGNYGVNYKFG